MDTFLQPLLDKLSYENKNVDTSLGNILQIINHLLHKHVPLKQITKKEIKTKRKQTMDNNRHFDINSKQKQNSQCI